MNKIELIHLDFDTAVETLIKIADLKEKKAASSKDMSPINDYEDGKWLASIGFENTVKAVKAIEFDLGKQRVINEKTANSQEATAIRNIIKRYSEIYPFHKFILYSQVINICEKYKIYLAPAQMYKGDIPQKNINEMKAFNLETYRNMPQYVPIIERNPICLQSTSACRSSKSNIQPYMCAPIEDFKKDLNTFEVGRELYYGNEKYNVNPFKFKTIIKLTPKIQDPIVLLPVLAKELNQIGFIVVTKWGLEANDIELQVGLNN